MRLVTQRVNSAQVAVADQVIGSIDRPGLFWPCWTAVEVACKVLDVPIMVWLSQHGLRVDRGLVRTGTFRVDDLVVTVGTAPEGG